MSTLFVEKLVGNRSCRRPRG